MTESPVSAQDAIWPLPVPPFVFFTRPVVEEMTALGCASSRSQPFGMPNATAEVRGLSSLAELSRWGDVYALG